jgi:mRNA-degrading endonuclease toxin of MazEF toxin-antitoxin module
VVAQAEIWLMETPNRKRRPVLVVSRDEVIPVLNNVVVAPVTSTVRNIPTCINVGSAEGLDHESVATFDNLAAVPKLVLTEELVAQLERAYREPGPHLIEAIFGP